MYCAQIHWVQSTGRTLKAVGVGFPVSTSLDEIASLFWIYMKIDHNKIYYSTVSPNWYVWSKYHENEILENLSLIYRALCACIIIFVCFCETESRNIYVWACRDKIFSWPVICVHIHSQFKCAFGFKKMFLKSFLISLFQPYLPNESYL